MILVLLMFTGCGGGEEEVCHAHQGMWQLVPRNVKQVDGPTASADDLAVEQARWSEPGRIHMVQDPTFRFVSIYLGDFSWAQEVP